MKQIYPDLWQGEVDHQLRPLLLRAYYLKSEQGHVLFYNTKKESDIEFIQQSGGLKYQYLSHCHEVDSSLAHLKQLFHHKLVAHHLVGNYLGEMVHLDILIKGIDEQKQSNAISIIPTPGHTNNSLCFYYKSPFGKFYLFTGDTMYLDHGIWKTLIFPRDGGQKADLVQSLLTLKMLAVDVIICSVALGSNTVVEVNQSEWESIIDALIKEV